MAFLEEMIARLAPSTQFCTVLAGEIQLFFETVHLSEIVSIGRMEQMSCQPRHDKRYISVEYPMTVIAASSSQISLLSFISNSRSLNIHSFILVHILALYYFTITAMRFTKAIFAGVISALYIAGGVSALDDCDVGPYASHNFMGYPGKYPVYFCNSKWKSGAVVTGIEVWATAWQIKGIRLEYSDGSDHMAGTNGGDRHDVLRWDAADKITDMKLAVNYAGDALGLVHVEVGEKKLDVRSDTGPSNGDEWNIGSGYMLGHAGDNGAMVSNWIPLFLGQTTGKAEITNIKFNDNLDEVNKQQKSASRARAIDVRVLTDV